MEISADSRSNGRRSKEEFDELRHTGNKPHLLIQPPGGIIEYPTRLRDRTRQFRIRKSKSDIEQDDSRSSNSHPLGSPLRQPQVPAEIHTGNDISDSQPP